MEFANRKYSFNLNGNKKKELIANYYFVIVTLSFCLLQNECKTIINKLTIQY